MRIFLELTGCEYDMNYPEARKLLADHLEERGFFKYPENLSFRELLDSPKATGEQAKAFFDSIKIFSGIMRGTAAKAD